MKKTTASLALMLALALAGCGGGSPSDEALERGSNAPTETTEVTPEAPETTPTPEATTETPTTPPEPESPEDAGFATWGQTWTWDDGLTATISAPEEFTPSEWSAGGEGAAAHVAFTIIVVNGTAAPFDPAMMMVTAQSGNTEASEVYDTENGFGGSPMTTVLPGRETSYKVGFGVSDPNDIVLEFTPSWDHDASIWTS